MRVRPTNAAWRPVQVRVWARTGEPGEERARVGVWPANAARRLALVGPAELVSLPARAWTGEQGEP